MSELGTVRARMILLGALRACAVALVATGGFNFLFPTAATGTVLVAYRPIVVATLDIGFVRVADVTVIFAGLVVWLLVDRIPRGTHNY